MTHSTDKPEQPDFEQIALEYANAKDRVLTSYHIGLKKGCFHGMQKVWNDYILPLQSRIKELEQENEELTTSLQVANTGLEILHGVDEENERLKQENERLKENLSRSLPF